MAENQNFSKDNDTVNVLTEQTENTENTQTEAKEDKHLMTLHLSHKNGSKTLHLKKGHLIAASVAALLVLGGGAYAGVSYLQAQNRLTTSQQQLAEMEKENRKLTQRTEMLENENEEYTQHINEIQMKTEELENKMTELENTKQSLAEEINNMSGTTTSTDGTAAASMENNDTASAEANLSNACLSILENGSTAQLGEKTFTTIVTTSYNKTAALSAQLDKMNVLMDLTGASFVDVATNVTETLAQYSNVPMGYPLEDFVFSTGFNPDGDPSISDGRVHKGIDLSTRSQILPISATAAGTVVESAYHDDYGYYVKIDHGNGFTTLYAHNSENLAEVGDTVKKGDVIAMTGSTGMSTGIHCHYEIQLNGIYQNPRDYE